MILVTLNSDELKELISTAISESLKNMAPPDSTYHDEDIVTAKQAAAILNISEFTIKKYARLGQIKRAMPHIKGFRFKVKEVKRFGKEYRPE